MGATSNLHIEDIVTLDTLPDSDMVDLLQKLEAVGIEGIVMGGALRDAELRRLGHNVPTKDIDIVGYIDPKKFYGENREVNVIEEVTKEFNGRMQKIFPGSQIQHNPDHKNTAWLHHKLRSADGAVTLKLADGKIIDFRFKMDKPFRSVEEGMTITDSDAPICAIALGKGEDGKYKVSAHKDFCEHSKKLIYEPLVSRYEEKMPGETENALCAEFERFEHLSGKIPGLTLIVEGGHPWTRSEYLTEKSKKRKVAIWNVKELTQGDPPIPQAEAQPSAVATPELDAKTFEQKLANRSPKENYSVLIKANEEAQKSQANVVSSTEPSAQLGGGFVKEIQNFRSKLSRRLLAPR